MSPDKIPSEKIEYELSQINKESEIIELLARKLSVSQLDEIELRAAAASMQSVYNGYEKILILILKSLKYVLPTTQSWHSDLLVISKDNNIISERLESQLRDLMAFRHFIRHSYSFMLDSEQLEPLLKNMEYLLKDFKREILSF